MDSTNEHEKKVIVKAEIKIDDKFEQEGSLKMETKIVDKSEQEGSLKMETKIDGKSEQKGLKTEIKNDYEKLLRPSSTWVSPRQTPKLLYETMRAH